MQRRLPVTVARLVFCIAASCTTLAAAAAPEDEVQSVAVTDSRDPVWKSYRKMLKGMDAFDRLHRLAPAASLKFLIRAQQENLPMDGMQMRIVGEHTDLLLPIAGDYTFELPRSVAAADDDAELRLNRSQKLYRFTPDIRSPGIAADARRLGDLRLECEVRWAVDKFDLSLVAAAYIGLRGGACHSSGARVFYTAPHAFTGVTLTYGERQQQLAADRLVFNGRQRYAPMLQDDSWPDDTIITFQTGALP